MAPLYDIDESVINLNDYSLEDSCYWLLHRLRIHEHRQRPYAIPLSNYILLWPSSVPLNAIIMGQNPYPNDIFPPIAAAMSFDENLSSKCENIKSKVTPTVAILANDLYVNANMDKDTTISLIKDGWALFQGGVLLVNDAVFHYPGTPEGYQESIDQILVIMRLLRETEGYGKRTVNIYAFGESGQRMASNLCSYYKSPIVTLSKHAVTHPAALARRFNDFSDPKCNMGAPSFSKNLAKCLSNLVALLHTMPTKQELEATLSRRLDAFRNLGTKLPEFESDINHTIRALDKFSNMLESDDIEALKAAANALKDSLSSLSIRSNYTASVITNAHNSIQGMSGSVTKAGPSIPTIPPSAGLSAPQSAEGGSTISRSVVFRQKRAPSTTTDVSNTAATPPPSDTPNASSPQSIGVSSIKFRKPRISQPAISTPVKPPDITTDTPSSTMPDSPSTPTPSKSATFRKRVPTQTSAKSETSGQKDKLPFGLSKEQANQLSCVRAVVEIRKPEIVDDLELSSELELLENDVENKSTLNTITQELKNAVVEDLKADPKFNFADWANDTDKRSATFDKCKETFKF